MGKSYPKYNILTKREMGPVSTGTKGQLMSSGLYKNGKMYGPFISYYENGQIQSQGNYNYNESDIYSRKDGVQKYYYENGKIESESIIKNGVEELKFYDKDGNLLPEGEGC